MVIKDYKITKEYSIPFFKNRNKLIKKINLIIYITYLSIFLLINRKNANLIIGNYLYEGQRSVCNLFSKQFSNIYIIDEGTSTINVSEQRKNSLLGNKKIQWKKTIFKTYHIPRPVIFYTNFLLSTNSIDKIILINHDNSRLLNKKVKKNVAYFIGSYLVEAGIISEDYYNSLLLKFINNNDSYLLYYIPHPKEVLVYSNHFIRDNDISIKKTGMGFEDYLLKSEIIPQIIASHISTAFHYSSIILGDKVWYQNYIINSSEILKPELINRVEQIYRVFDNQMKHLNFSKIV